MVRTGAVTYGLSDMTQTVLILLKNRVQFSVLTSQITVFWYVDITYWTLPKNLWKKQWLSILDQNGDWMLSLVWIIYLCFGLCSCFALLGNKSYSHCNGTNKSFFLCYWNLIEIFMLYLTWILTSEHFICFKNFAINIHY